MVHAATRAEAVGMDAMTAVGHPRFSFTKPPLGKSRGVVIVGPSTVRIEHPTFKQAIEVPIANLILVPVDHDAVAVPLLKRDPKVVRLGVSQYAEANLALVFRQPVPFGRSKWGSQQGTGITAREQRQGLSVDVVALSLADPGTAAVELRSRGAAEASNLSDALVGVIGVPEGLELEERKRRVAKARKRAYRGLMAWGLAMAVAIPLRFAANSDAPTSRFVHLGGSALAWGVLFGVATFSLTGHQRDPSGPATPRPKRTPTRAAVVNLALTFGSIGALGAAWAGARSLSGASQTVALGAVLGLPSGVILGMVLRSASAMRHAPDPVVRVGVPIGFTLSPPPPHASSISPRSATPSWPAATRPTLPLDVTWPGGPVDAAEPRPRRRLRRKLGIALAVVVGGLAVVVAIGFIALAFDHSPDDGLAGRATVTATELPPDWTTYRDQGPLGRDVMDDHICGNEPGTLPNHTGSYDRQFGYHFVNGTELAHLDVGVLVSPTAASAAQEFAAAVDNGPTYQSCVAARAVKLSKIGSPKALGDPVTSINRATIEGIPGTVDQITVTTETADGFRTTYVAFVRLQIGRIIVRMPVTTWGKPMSGPQLLAIIQAEQREAEAALAADA
jgi:hypothetical protein